MTQKKSRKQNAKDLNKQKIREMNQRANQKSDSEEE